MNCIRINIQQGGLAVRYDRATCGRFAEQHWTPVCDAEAIHSEPSTHKHIYTYKHVSSEVMQSKKLPPNMAQPMFWTPRKWQVIIGNDWEESIKSFRKVRIQNIFPKNRTLACTVKICYKTGAAALVAAAEHMFSQWSSVTSPGACGFV